jgi:hypothetical protein
MLPPELFILLHHSIEYSVVDFFKLLLELGAHFIDDPNIMGLDFGLHLGLL